MIRDFALAFAQMVEPGIVSIHLGPPLEPLPARHARGPARIEKSYALATPLSRRLSVALQALQLFDGNMAAHQMAGGDLGQRRLGRFALTGGQPPGAAGVEDAAARRGWPGRELPRQ